MDAVDRRTLIILNPNRESRVFPFPHVLLYPDSLTITPMTWTFDSFVRIDSFDLVSIPFT